MRAFAQKMADLLQNPVLAEELGKGAQAHVMNAFDGEKNTEKIVRLWKHIAIH
jgi:glycosyltransferase involved in cell wall biosynthesis